LFRMGMGLDLNWTELAGSWRWFHFVGMVALIYPWFIPFVTAAKWNLHLVIRSIKWKYSQTPKI